MTKETTTPLVEQVGINIPGWYCLQNETENWFVGNATGILCYATQALARAVATVASEMDGGESFYRLCVFSDDGPIEHAGLYETAITADQALTNIESYTHTPSTRRFHHSANSRKWRRITTI